MDRTTDALSKTALRVAVRADTPAAFSAAFPGDEFRVTRLCLHVCQIPLAVGPSKLSAMKPQHLAFEPHCEVSVQLSF